MLNFFLKPPIALCFFVLALTNPVFAQTADEQVETAMHIFRPELELSKSWKYHAMLTDGLAGRWFEGIDNLMDATTRKIAPDILAKGCASLGVDISVSDYQFKISKTFKRADASAAVMDKIFTDHGAGNYAFYTDPQNYLERIGIADAKDEAHAEKAHNALRFSSGLANVYRPSKDVLVVISIAGVPEFLLRCP